MHRNCIREACQRSMADRQECVKPLTRFFHIISRVEEIFWVLLAWREEKGPSPSSLLAGLSGPLRPGSASFSQGHFGVVSPKILSGSPVREWSPQRPDASCGNEPALITRLTEVSVVPFGEVTAEYAAIEGEGDGSLEYWRRGHWAFFTRECHLLGREPLETMPVVCCVFEVLALLPPPLPVSPYLSVPPFQKG